jgi:5-methylcytosine-specific restriction endonuclease McrA
LSKQPLCQSCILLGRIVGAVHVDHVIAWKPIGPHAFTANRFQSLCAPCHSVKTGLENRGVFRHYTDRGVVDYSPGDWGRMMQQPDPDPAPARD